MSSRKNKLIVSLDIGNVLLDRGREGRADPQKIPALKPVEGALDGVRALVRASGRENVFVVSRCKEESEVALLAWLRTSGFAGCGVNQIDPDNVRFCRQRAEKAGILAKIGATAHVDDRAEVLVATGKVDSLLLRVLFAPNETEMAYPGLGDLPGLVAVQGWKPLPQVLLKGAVAG